MSCPARPARVVPITPTITRCCDPWAAATGIAQPTVGLGSLRNFDVPVPPLAEQDRIVTKVDQLMALCDDLEAKLRHRDDRAGKLVAAVVGEMVSG